MLCGYLPFEDKNNNELFKNILDCKVKYPKYVGEKSKDLIQKILVNDPNERINISEIKEHPFFLKRKTLFEQEFSLCHNSSEDADLKFSNSNIIKKSNIEEKKIIKKVKKIVILKMKKKKRKRKKKKIK